MQIAEQKSRGERALERALEKAAKIICNLKIGCCPVKEKNFPGCPCECHEEIVPWQCWLIYLHGIRQG